MNDHGSSDDLQLLGVSKMDYPESPDDCVLETIPWAPRTGRGTRVELNCPEFTSLCPKTGQPDFGKIIIEYEPRGRLIESKSLKIYLFSFRNHGDFHETTVQRIASDLFDALEPYWIEVRGEYLPRGGISIWPCAQIASPDFMQESPEFQEYGGKDAGTVQ